MLAGGGGEAGAITATGRRMQADAAVRQHSCVVDEHPTSQRDQLGGDGPQIISRAVRYSRGKSEPSRCPRKGSNVGSRVVMTRDVI